MTAREQAIIGGIQSVNEPTSLEGAQAIAALFAGDTSLFIDFLDPDSIESWGERIARVQKHNLDEVWSSKLLAAHRAHPGAFAHLFDPVAA